MRIDFNILWVEDQQANVAPQRDRMAIEMRKEGFRLQVKFVSSVEEAAGALSEEVYGDHIDLILMDFELGSGKRGDEGLAVVRSMFPYKELIFYSANASNLMALAQAKGVQGVFCATREDLTRDVVSAFQTLIKKVVDIDHARGIVMGASSDIDTLVLNGLSEQFRKAGGKLSDGAKGIIEKEAEKIKKRLNRDMEALKAVADVDTLRQLHSVYTSMHRHKLLRKLLESDSNHKDLCTGMIAYQNEVTPKRNELAHLSVTVRGFERKLYNKDGTEVTREMIRELQRGLLEHQDALEGLVERLKQE